ncbi:F-box domain-containing protein [Poronia punctata]|nr:F-box domain-containing protein [Poronia punctata]
MADSDCLYLLPDEILLHIIHFLGIPDVITLQSVSKRFLRICRDNPHWRLRCLQTSAVHEDVSLYRRGWNLVDEDGVPINQVTPTNGNPQTYQNVTLNIENIGSVATRRRRDKEHSRIAANWDPTFPNEQTNWYHEYIQRHAPMVTSWFQRPQIDQGAVENPVDVRGVALYRPSAVEHDLFAVSPLDDGSVCLWDVKGTKGRKGSILSKSKPGLLWGIKDITHVDIANTPIDKGIIECVSVDSHRHAAFFAVGKKLLEVDLRSQAVVSTSLFEWDIKTLSTADPTVPLTIGTAKGLHLHDYRVHYSQRREDQVLVDPSGVLYDHPGTFKALAERRPPAPHSDLAKEGLQHIHHMSQPGRQDMLSDDIFVAGRFSSVLHYDRRMFPTIKGSIHSGGRICSLTSLPYPFSSLDSDLRRRLQLSEDQVRRSKNMAGGRTLIACGEYNTKGSLEIYGLSSTVGDGNGTDVSYDGATKNRQTASQSKLLSVINHGNRIAFSDGQGYIKWMERDGFTEVRRHQIGRLEKTTQRSLFREATASDEIARKILSTRTNVDNTSTPNDDDILFWTGEALGLLSYSPKPGFSAEDFVDCSMTPEEAAADEEGQLYAERMRLVLERQADEVRYVHQLGAGVPPLGWSAR